MPSRKTRDKKAVLTVEEAAEFLSMKKGHVYSLVRQEAIPYKRIGSRFIRFWRSDLEAYMRSDSDTQLKGGEKHENA